MRLQKANCEKERLPFLLQRVQTLHGFVRRGAVGELIIRLWTHFKRGPALGFLVPLGRAIVVLGRCGIGVFLNVHVVRGDEFLRPIIRVRVHRLALRIPLWLAPGTSILQADVIHLAEPRAPVAILFEVLWQGDAIRLSHAEMCDQVPHLCGIRSQAREHRRARWRAHRLLAVGVIEDQSTRRDAVDVRGLHDLVPIAPEFGSKVIDGDEEDVGLCCECRMRNDECRSEESEEVRELHN